MKSIETSKKFQKLPSKLKAPWLGKSNAISFRRMLCAIRKVLVSKNYKINLHTININGVL